MYRLVPRMTAPAVTTHFAKMILDLLKPYGPSSFNIRARNSAIKLTKSETYNPFRIESILEI